jgi:dihydroorotase
LRGIPHQSEEVMIARDIMLADLTGGHLHLAHVSTAGSVDLIRQAKRKRIRVTAETCPHYFTLTEECVKNYDTNTKMKPPLRTAEDIAAIKKGLIDGSIDCIATDHAPHNEEEKNTEYDSAPFGIIGFETMLSLVVMELIDRKLMDWIMAIDKLSTGPAKVFGIKDRGTLKTGSNADIAIIDPDKKYIFTKDSILSKSKNSPFINYKMKGAVVMTISGGNVVWQEKTKN